MTETSKPKSSETRGDLAIGRRALAIILIGAAVGAAAALGVSFLLPREYSASVTLLPVKSERPSELNGAVGQLGGLASLAGIGIGNDDDRSEAIATLRSRALASAFIEQHKLLPMIFQNKWDAASGRWRSKDSDDAPTLNDGYRRFDRKIRSVTEDRRTGIVTVTITWRDPALAAGWANELAARVNREMRDRAIDEARRSLEYLNRELDKTQVVELRQPIYRLIENRINTVMLANVRDEYAFKIVDPATPPDADDYSRPLHWLFALAGAILGALAGAASALLGLTKKRDVH
jgi:uncharacterized protein involved in exopolysaccharide biosynthesis